MLPYRADACLHSIYGICICREYDMHWLSIEPISRSLHLSFSFLSRLRAQSFVVVHSFCPIFFQGPCLCVCVTFHHDEHFLIYFHPLLILFPQLLVFFFFGRVGIQDQPLISKVDLFLRPTVMINSTTIQLTHSLEIILWVVFI